MLYIYHCTNGYETKGYIKLGVGHLIIMRQLSIQQRNEQKIENHPSKIHIPGSGLKIDTSQSTHERTYQIEMHQLN